MTHPPTDQRTTNLFTALLPAVHRLLRARYFVLFATMLASALTLQIVAAADSSTYQINAAHSGVQIDNALAPPFVKRWQTTFGTQPSIPVYFSGRVSYPVVAQNKVYVVEQDAYSFLQPTTALQLIALDQATGKIVWSAPLPSHDSSANLAYDQGRVFVSGSSGTISTFDAAAGSALWTAFLPNVYSVSVPPTAQDGTLYIGASSTLFAIDEITGNTLFSTSLPIGGNSSVALSDTHAFVSYPCSTVAAFSRTSLATFWQTTGTCSPGTDSAIPVYESNRVFTRHASIPRNVVTNATSGSVEASYSVVGDDLGTTVAVRDNMQWGLYAGSVVALDITNPAAPVPVWTFAGDGQISTAPIVVSTPVGDFVIVGSGSGMLYAIDAAKGGAAVWSANIGTSILGSESFTYVGLGAGDGTLVVPTNNSVSAFSSAPSSGYVPVTPARLLDSRSGYTTIDGQFVGAGPLAGGSVVDLKILGRGAVPTTNVTAVVVNVTATQPSAAGYITAWPTGSEQPNASNLNFVTGETTANLIVLPIGEDGKVSFYCSPTSGSIQLVADVVGYFTGASKLHPTAPMRILDTRPSYSTVDGLFAGSGSVSGAGTLNLTLAGRAGLPLSGIGAVVMNVTATNTTNPGYLTVWATDGPQPATSNLNFLAGETIPNLVVSRVSSNGQVSIFNSSGTTDLISDLEAWFPAEADLISVNPARILDTRSGAVTVDGQYASIGALGISQTLNLVVGGRAGIPTLGVGAVVLNVTATAATSDAYISVWPAGSGRPNASSLNIAPGGSVSNLVIAKLGGGSAISLFNSAGSTDLVVDVVGWFPTSQP